MTVQQKLKDAGLLVDTEAAAKNREIIEHMRLGEVIAMISLEKQNKIIQAYKRGDTVKKIVLDTGCATGDVYKVISFHRIPLRSNDPNHPASSMEVRDAAGIVAVIPRQEKPTVPAVEPVKEPVKITTPVTKSPGQIFYEKRGLKTPWYALGKRSKERYEQTAAGTYVRKSYELRDWEKEKEQVIEDYNNMGLREFLKKWGLNSLSVLVNGKIN
jgi:hypothetical protein